MEGLLLKSMLRVEITNSQGVMVGTLYALTVGDEVRYFIVGVMERDVGVVGNICVHILGDITVVIIPGRYTSDKVFIDGREGYIDKGRLLLGPSIEEMIKIRGIMCQNMTI